MDSSLFAGIIAIACITLVFADNASKVKLVDAKNLHIDGEYFNPDTFIFEIIKGNATYNFLHIAFDLIKDLPADAQNSHEIYRADKGNCTYEKIKEFSISLCSNNNSEYAQYLSDDFQKIKQSASCGLKTHYENDHATYVKFYNLLTDEQLENGSFKTINGITSGTKYLYKEELDFESNPKKLSGISGLFQLLGDKLKKLRNIKKNATDCIGVVLP